VGGSPIEVGVARPVGHEAARFRELSEWVNGGEPVLHREIEYQPSMLPGDGVWEGDDAADFLASHGRERPLDVINSARLPGQRRHLERAAGVLDLAPHL